MPEFRRVVDPELLLITHTAFEHHRRKELRIFSIINCRQAHVKSREIERTNAMVTLILIQAFIEAGIPVQITIIASVDDKRWRTVHRMHSSWIKLILMSIRERASSRLRMRNMKVDTEKLRRHSHLADTQCGTSILERPHDGTNDGRIGYVVGVQLETIRLGSIKKSACRQFIRIYILRARIHQKLWSQMSPRADRLPLVHFICGVITALVETLIVKWRCGPELLFVILKPHGLLILLHFNLNTILL